MTTRAKGSITAQAADQSKKPKAVTGTAGVHFVAYRLSCMGYIAALTREGSPAVDLMACSPKSGKAVSVQVKTATNAAQKKGKGRRKDGILYWPLGRSASELRSKEVFYAFVDMKGCPADKPRPREAPDVFIVPAGWVADRKHRNVPNGATALASVNTYPKDKEPSSFWFDLYCKGQKKWAENWELITDILDRPTTPLAN